MKPGDRVAAIIKATPTVVEFAGLGEYMGDFPCPHIGGIPNPLIKLDNGKQIWGCQCWWGEEQKVMAEHAGKQATMCDPNRLEPYVPVATPTTADYADMVKKVGRILCGVEVNQFDAMQQATTASEQVKSLLTLLANTL